MLKWEYRAWKIEKPDEGLGNGESGGDEREANMRAVGSNASATTNRIGAGKKRKDIITVTKKKSVLNPLKAFLFVLSFKKPMVLVFRWWVLVRVDLRYKNGGVETEETGRKDGGFDRRLWRE